MRSVWLWLVQFEGVIDASRAHSLIGHTQADIFELPLHGDVELMDPPVIRIEGIPRHRLRSNAPCPCRERIRPGQYGCRVVEECFGQLEGPVPCARAKRPICSVKVP